MKRTGTAVATAALWLALGAPLLADDYKLGDLVIERPHARATPPGAPVAGGYVTIRNTGATPDRLIAISADFAGRAEVHEMKMDGGVMRMRPVLGGLEIPAGGEVALKPGGKHLMFMKLARRLKEGETRKATLKFEKAGEIEVEFTVEAMGAKRGHAAGGGDGHKR